MLKNVLVVVVVLCLWGVEGRKYCQPNDASCWPTDAEVQQLYDSLDPSAVRILKWDGEGTPKPGPIPIFSPNNQPLYGLGNTNMEPLYTKQPADYYGCYAPLNTSSPTPTPTPTTTRNKGATRTLPGEEVVEGRADQFYVSEFCQAATRNNPMKNIDPIWVAWPLSKEHVKSCLDFANEHDLAVCVAGTGHDYINRHNCENGLFIRMALLKDISWNLDDPRGENGGGTVTLGPGNVFEEIQASAAEHNRFVASGWCSTVGIVGWSIGGGHGPFAPSVGLGVDNIVEIEIMTAATEVLIANSTSNPDLFWSLRGGGSSTFGIITSITIRGHLNPPFGFTDTSIYYTGTFCDKGPNNNVFLSELITHYLSWSVPLDQDWSGFTFFITRESNKPGVCGATWIAWINYLYLGDPESDEFKNTISNLTSVGGLYKTNSTTFTQWIDQNLGLPIDPIYPVEAFPQIPQVTVGSIPSTTVAYENVANGTLASYVIEQVNQCPQVGRCGWTQIYQDITGNVGSPQNPNVSIGPGLRSDFMHFVIDFISDVDEMDSALKLGNGAYFSESAYQLEGFRDIYWGEENFAKLKQTKKTLDPTRRFGCHHCVDFDDEFDSPPLRHH